MRRPDPASPTWIVLGASVTGGSTYVLLIATAAGLGQSGFNAFSVYWAVLITMTVGGFLPIEQIIARRTAGEGDTSGLMRWAWRWGAVSSVCGALVLGSASLMSGLNGIDRALVVVLASNLLAMAGQASLRGLAAGRSRLDVYALIVSSDALLRTAAALAGAVFAVESVLFYAVAICGACGASVCAGLVLLRGPAGRGMGDQPTPGLTREAISLVPAMLAMQAILNSAVIIAFVLPGGGESAGAVMALASLARTSVFLIQGAQAAYVGRVARLVFEGDSHARRVTGLVVWAAVALGSMTALGSWVLGPWIVAALYGEQFVVSRSAALAIGVGIGLFVIAVAANDLRVAWGRHQRSGYTWVASAAVAVAIAAMPLLQGDARIFLPTIVGSAMALVLLAPWWSRRTSLSA